MEGISKSRVSELCEELDEEVERFRNRPLEGSYPYVWVDATYLKARQDGRVVSTAVVIAVGVKAQSGEREVLGFDVGPSEDGAFWSAFLRSLVARGLSGVRLVTSDAHRGLKSAVAAVLVGASWQRCRVHTIRTQSGSGRCRRTSRPPWRAVQGDDVAYLQGVFSHNNGLDQ
jgi:putative transposase